MKELDARDFSHRAERPGAAAVAARAETATRTLPGAHRVEVEGLRPRTGTPSRLISHQAEGTAPDVVEEAALHLRAVAPVLGGTAAAAPDFVPDSAPLVTSTGTRVVHFQQHHRGIPCFEMVRTVRLSPAGAVEDVVGDNQPIRGPIDVEPTLPVAEATRIACRYLSRKDPTRLVLRDHHGEATLDAQLLSRVGRPRVLSSFALPSRPTTLAIAPLEEPVEAQLVLFYLAPETQLGWLVTVLLPELAGEYELIVAANGRRAGELLYCRNTIGRANARGSVFESNPGTAGRVRVPFPPADYPALGPQPPPAGFPLDWVASDRASGNNVIALRGNGSQSLAGTLVDGVVEFFPADEEGADQRLLNAFYFCNYLHDLFLLLGFDEASGNFQAVNFTGAPGGRDELRVRIHSQVLSGTARMRSRRDGRNPEMRLGPSARSSLHTALDADIVFHEFAHGVTQRLVGGRLNFSPLVQPQSRAMGEGWSDYFALTIQSHAGESEKTIFGEWLAGSREGARPRRGSYGDDFEGHFGLLGTSDFTDPHDAGEIWCAALMRMNRLIAANLGGDARRGHEVGWQLVVDSLKLISPSPSFLDGRDGLFKAVDDMLAAQTLGAAEHAAVRAAVEAAFTALGMGPSATANGASFEGVVADFG